MNEIIAKRALIFSLILGACIGIAAILPPMIGFALVILMFLSAPTIIIYMKKNEKYLNVINNEESAKLGAIIGFAATIGFFASFAPLVCILKLIFKTYYAYMIPDMLQTALWLFVILVFVIALVFAATNAVSAMGIAWLYSRFEKTPDEENRLDMKIED